MPHSFPIVFEIDALPPDPLRPMLPREPVVGVWGGGPRFIHHEGQLVSTHVWFHFAPDGSAAVSIRYDGERHSRFALGRWFQVDEVLTLDLGRSRIQSPAFINSNVMHWAGEVLVRVSERPVIVEQA